MADMCCVAVAAEKYDPEADDDDDGTGQVNNITMSRIVATSWLCQVVTDDYKRSHVLRSEEAK